MAATGKTPILLYGSTTATNQPSAGNLTNSSDGCEIAINVADKNLFFKDATNTVNTVPIRQSSASSNGWLSSTDWSTFNSKQPAGSYAVTNAGQTFSGTQVFTSSPSLTSASDIRVSYTNSGWSKSWLLGTNANQFFLYDSTGSAVSWSVDASNNFKVDTGNLVIGTSGKGIDFSATSAGIIWRTGVGSPEGVVTAAVGSLYTRSDGGVGTTLYVKQSGTGNTGWAAK